MDDIRVLKKIIDERKAETNLEVVLKYYFGDVRYASQDGLPDKQLLLLKNDERNAVVEYTIKNLKKGDWRAVRAAGDLKLEIATPHLKRLLNSFRSLIDGYYKVDVALSIWKITKDINMKYIIQKIFLKTKSCIIKARVLFAFRYFEGSDVVDFIIKALDDDCEMLRSSAVESALFKLGADFNAGSIHPWVMKINSTNTSEVDRCKTDIIFALKKIPTT